MPTSDDDSSYARNAEADPAHSEVEPTYTLSEEAEPADSEAEPSYTWNAEDEAVDSDGEFGDARGASVDVVAENPVGDAEVPFSATGALHEPASTFDISEAVDSPGDDASAESYQPASEFDAVAEPAEEDPLADTEPEAAPPVELAATARYMAIDLEVSADYLEATGSLAAAMATAVELVTAETWEDYQPTVVTDDAESAERPDQDAVVVFDFASIGIERAEAPLTSDASIAFGIGAIRDTVSFHGQAIGVSHRASISMSYDPERIGEFEAARFLASVRAVMETPGDSIAA